MAERQYDVSWPGWNVVGILGYGSYGRVYEIERDVFGHTEKAALKVISIPQNSGEIDELYNDGYDSESITQRFKSHLKEIVREYSLMSEMKGHTNIVYCDDLRYVQHDDGMGWDIYIKMELLTPLPKILGNGFSEKLVIKLGLDICNALILCKSKNIVHRDIKPQNIFVSEDKNFKLGDFGIAKTAERTTSGTKTGTYKYMAPEVYNNQPYGHAADIYSLGMVLYWLLNERRTPFLPLPPQVPTATDEEHARDSRFAGFSIPEPLHGSDALKRIVLKACAFWPEDRYKNAAEMRKDLLTLARNGTYTSKNQYIKSPAENEPKRRIPVPDTDETVGNFGHVQKEETPSEETVGVFSRSTANERPRKKPKGLLPIFVGIILFIIILFLAFIIGSTISHFHSATKSNERNTEFPVGIQPEIDRILNADPNPSETLLSSMDEETDSSETASLETTAPTQGRNDSITAAQGESVPNTDDNVTQVDLNNSSSQAITPQVTLTGISVKSIPNRTSYYVGDVLETQGLQLIATYSNGSTESISSGFTCSPNTLNTIGQQRIMINYCGKSTSFQVDVIAAPITPVTITEISILALPGKTSYYVGDTLETDGLQIKVTFSDGSSEVLSSGFTCSPNLLSNQGNQTITVSYDGRITYFQVNVDPAPTSPVRTISWKFVDASYEYLSEDRTLKDFVIVVLFDSSSEDYSGLSLTSSFDGEVVLGPTRNGSSGGCVHIRLPDNPALEGWQTLTLYFDGTSRSIQVYLKYLGSYSQYIGMSVDDVNFDGIGWDITDRRDCG